MHCHSLASHLCRAVFVACVLTVLCALAPALSSAAQVTLTWDANTDPDLAGYKLYYGTSSRSYQLSVDVGNVTSYTLSGLLEGQIYYFAATAYTVSHNESGFSNEVSKAIADVTPPTVSLTTPAAGATISGTVTVSASATDNVGVVGVQFKLDSVNLGAEVSAAPYTISWTTTTNGAHTLTAVARDAAGNTATSAAVSVTVANAPPVISAVSAFNISSSAATITWATNAASDSQVDYGPTTAYGSSTPLNSSLLTAHAMTLTGLLATTTYHYRVKSRDAAGNLATSADFTLATLAGAVADLTPPAVSMTAPTSGATVSGTVTVSASASDNVGVVGVQFKLDGVNLGAEVTAAPYSTSWNTTLAANGAHTLTAVARDAAGNTATSPAVTINVNNTPPPTGGTAYYVDQTAGNDNNNGASPSTPWKNAPGMLACAGICASTTLNPGDTVYFDSADIWSLAAGAYGLHVKGGVTYIGDSWGSGIRATLRAMGPIDSSIIDIREDNPSYPTVVKGFDVDANTQVTNGVGINYPFYTSPLTGAVKRVDNLVVHNTWSRTSLGQFKYGIIISNWGGAAALVQNVEVLNSIVHDTSRDGLNLYPGDVSADCVIQNITVRGNEVYNTGQDPDYGAGAGIIVKGHVLDAFIENNYVHDTKGAGLFVNGNENTHYGVGPTNIHFRFNIVTVNTIHGAIRIYDGSSGKDPKDIKIYGNVVYNSTTNGGFLIDTDLGNTNSLLVYNNTFFNAPVIINNTTATFNPFEFKNNIVYYPGGTPITGSNRFTSASNNLTTNPSFNNTANLPTGFTGTYGVDMVPNTDGLSLLSGSPAIDMGVSLGSAYNGSVNTIVRPVGSGWDIGAYEYTGSTLPPDTTPPTVSITAPAAGATVSGTISVAAIATDNVGVIGVQFKLDGVNLGAEITAAPYTLSWNTATASNRLHTLTAVARDAAGNTATATAVNVTVSNSAPDITPPSVPTNLSASAVSSSQMNLSWTASTDNVGVAGYTIYRGASQIATTSLTSYSDTGLSPSSTYSYTVVAYDAAGNVSALSVAASAATLPPPAADIASGLVLYYKFDEGAGSLATDSSDAGNTGSLLGGTTWTVGPLGQAVNFDGVSGNVTAATTTGLNLATTLTIAAWINPSDVSATYRTLVAKGGYGVSARGYGVNLFNGHLNFIKVGIVDVTSSVSIITGSWQHVAITWNAATSEVKFYKNGTLAQTIIDAAAITAPLDTDNLLVGLWLLGGSYFAGAMDELRIYNRVLSATDLVALYNITPPTVSITAPTAGATVSGTVTLSANATDNVGIAGVQFTLDGANLGAELTTAPYTISWTTTTALDGSHTLTAVARDAAGNVATSAAVSVTVFNDTTPPAVSMTAPAAGSTVTGTITVSASATDNVGVVGVQFKLDGANLGAEVTTAPYAISWNSTLATSGAHSLTAVARDAAGNTATAAAVSVTMDNTPPTISISSPAPGATVAGTILVSNAHSDNVGVVGVQFKLDGANLGPEVTAAPYAISWNTTLVANGTHSLTAVARDAAGNTATATAVSVTVDNAPPTVSITAPAAGSTVTGTITISASATDNVGVVGVQFQLDGVNLGAEVTAAPYAISWNSTTASNGVHTLTAVARDAAGNIATSAGVSVTVFNDTTPPAVSMTAPAAGATVAGTITVSASATDNVGVVGVQFKLDGANLGAEVMVAPYVVSWTTTTALDGSHTLTAVVRDAAGNAATSAAVSVTVDNSPPTISISSPNPGAMVSGTIIIRTSNAHLQRVGLAGVQFKLDGINLGAEVTASPWTVSWDTTLVANGNHNLIAVARDVAGNTAISAAVSVTVNNPVPDTTPPTLSMTAPAAGATVAGTITVSASATDNVGVVGVQFKLDGSNLSAEVMVAPYVVSWTTTTASNGVHTLTAIARDAAGNVATSSVVSVTVANGDTIPPTVAITAPVDGTNVVGFTIVSVQAADNVGVSNVKIYGDSALIGTVACGAGLSCSGSVKWNITGPAGVAHSGVDHSIYAVATDTSGNSSSSIPITVFK